MILRKMLIVFSLFIFLQASSQELPTLFKSESFSSAYFNPTYQNLKQRQESNLYLSKKEKEWLEIYQAYIDDYFSLLNENQQNLFYQKRATIEFKKDSSNQYIPNKSIAVENNEEIDNVNKDRDTELLLGNIIFSGVSGIAYGLQLNYLLDVDNTSSAVGLTMLMSGGSMLIPIFSKQYKDINSNSLWLRAHGKIMGGIYGYTLSAAMFGDNIFEQYEYDPVTGVSSENRNKKPFAVGLSLLGSISMGQLGFYFGKNKPWTDGRIATYQYYSYFLPALSSSLYASFYDNTTTRNFGILISASVPLGYLTAHHLSNKIEYTRGDMTAIINNTIIGGMIGLSIPLYGDLDNNKSILFPISGAVLGSLAGHFTYRNFHITRPEGRRLNYAAIGGGLIGLGTTFLVDPKEEATYLLIPALFGAAGYGILLNYYRKHPSLSKNKKNGDNFNFALHPESFFLNKNLPPHLQAPFFSMRLKL